MDRDNHKEFRASRDGRCLAIGSADNDVTVVRLADEIQFTIPGVSYQFGGRRLTVDSQNGRLFSGSYHETGVAAYDIKTGECFWHRKDLKKLQHIVYDPHEDVVYCAFEDKASRPLKASDGRERRPIRGLKGFHFSETGEYALFEFDDLELRNRSTGDSHRLPRVSWAVLDVAFNDHSVVVSWVSGPVIAYDLATSEQQWRYLPEGTHAYSIAPSFDRQSVWLAEQPYQEPPAQRLRLLSSEGEILREIRCSLGNSFAILPLCNKVIRTDCKIVGVDAIESSSGDAG